MIGAYEEAGYARLHPSYVRSMQGKSKGGVDRGIRNDLYEISKSPDFRMDFQISGMIS